MGKQRDSIVCYQKLEDNIDFIQKNGMDEFEKQQKTREKLLWAILAEFNEGRSKTLYCIAATILEIGELESILEMGREKSNGLDIKAKSEVMHSFLNEIAENKNYLLKLRKWKRNHLFMGLNFSSLTIIDKKKDKSKCWITPLKELGLRGSRNENSTLDRLDTWCFEGNKNFSS